MMSGAGQSHGRITCLWFQITMNVPKFVKFVHTDEHFSGVEAGMFFLKHTRVVEQCSKVAPWNVFLSWFNMQWKPQRLNLP